MANIVTTGSIPRGLMPGVRTFLLHYLDAYEGEYKQIYETYQSDKMFEIDIEMKGLGVAPIKAEGDAISMAAFKQSYAKKYVNVVRGIGTAISHELMEDIQYGDIKPMQLAGKFLADSLNQTKEIVGAALLNNMTSTSEPYVGGDGKALIASDHPLAAGGTFSNLASADLSEAALEQAVIDIAKFKDPSGLQRAYMPVRLIVPVDSWAIACRILKSPLRVGTADNDINALKENGYMEYVVNHFLTDTDMWIIKTNADNGFKHFQREGYKLDNHNDFLTNNILIKAMERYCFGFSDPRCAYGSTGV